MRYKNKNEKIAAIEKQTTRLKELLETYQGLLKECIDMQGDKPTFDKNGDIDEKVGKKLQEAFTIEEEMNNEFKELSPYLFFNVSNG